MADDPPSPARDGRISVVVLTYERAAEVCRTLERLLALPEQPHVIVVDNGSRGPSVERVMRAFPGVELVVMTRNLGAAARNAGVLRARTRYVAFCDDDTWWAPGALARAADLLDAHRDLAVVTGHVLVGGEERDDPACVAMARSPLPACPPLPGRPILGYLAGASVARRAAFLDVGGYQARFFLGGEEALVALDLATHGWQLAYVPELVVHHHPSRLRDAGARRRLLLRNALWVAWLRRPATRALRETVRLAAGAWRDPELSRGLVEAVIGFAWVLRNRRVVPPTVERSLRLVEAAGGSGLPPD